MSLVNVTTHSFGVLPSGTEAQLFTLSNSEVTLTLTTFGARVVSLLTKDREGVFADISLGYAAVEDYAIRTNAFFGATIGRYGNRIAHGQFELDSKRYRVPTNNGVNALHGGPVGFDQRNWTASVIPGGVEFTLISEDEDQGFPGSMHVSATYTLEGDAISLRYRAESDAPTVVNLTNHTYFNLSGEGSGTVLDDEISIFADSITAIDEILIPTGELMPVAGTPFDFTSSRKIGSRIAESHPQLLRAKGYDHNFILRSSNTGLREAARLRNAVSGRVLEVSTTEPGMQFYSGNFLDGSLVGKSGKPYARRGALCLETQHFPDSPNHPNFPSTVLRPGELYASETVWRFSQD